MAHVDVGSPRSLFAVVCHPRARALAVVVLVLSFVLPTSGLGIDLCWFKAVTHYPCPGCGLTRSLINLSHGDLWTALRYHPFGPLVYAGAWGLVALVVGGAPAENRARAWFTARELTLRRVYHLVVFAFLTFGFARLAVAFCWPGAVPLP